jgi:hypothetical protein
MQTRATLDCLYSSLPPCGGGTGRGVSMTSIVLHHPHLNPPSSRERELWCEAGAGGDVSWRTSVRERCAGHRRKASARFGSSYEDVRLPDTASVVSSVSDRTSPTSRVLSAASSSRSTAAHTMIRCGGSAIANAINGSLRRDFASFVLRTERCLRIQMPRLIGSANFLASVRRTSAPPPPQPSPIKGEGVKLVRSPAGVRHRHRLRKSRLFRLTR